MQTIFAYSKEGARVRILRPAGLSNSGDDILAR